MVSVAQNLTKKAFLVTCAINSFPVVLLNIYAPNFNCPDFFCEVFNLVSEYNTHNIIIGGDFNCYSTLN